MISAGGQERAELYSIGIESCIVGAAISAAVGYASIRVLIRLVVRGKFYLFAFYCFAIGIATFFLLIHLSKKKRFFIFAVLVESIIYHAAQNCT